MHHAIEKMQHRARSTLYWPGIDADIATYIKHCKICTQHKTTQHIQPILPRYVPESLWQDLATDIFNIKNKEKLLITDTFSKYFFSFKMSTKTADTIAHKFTQLFSQYGTPKCLSTDNGLPYLSETFTKFLLNQRVEYITSSPYYLKSNAFIKDRLTP